MCVQVENSVVVLDGSACIVVVVVVVLCVFFFFKQKTAYEMLRSLVGSEMCIRDRTVALRRLLRRRSNALPGHGFHRSFSALLLVDLGPVSYTHLTLPTIYSV